MEKRDIVLPGTLKIVQTQLFAGYNPLSVSLPAVLLFLGFPPPQAVEGRQPRSGETYSVCTCSHGRRHCNKFGTQAPRRGMQFWPILQHCSNSIALLGDCSNS